MNYSVEFATTLWSGNTLPLSAWFLASLLISAILAYPIFRLLILLKSRQTVSQYAPEGHQKKQGTPTMGGLIVAAGFLLTMLLLAPKYGSPSNKTFNLQLALLFAEFALIGFIDDFVVPRYIKGKRGLGWKQKIVMQLVAAVVFCWALGAGFSLTAGAVVFLILFFSNGYNFADGLDWLAGTLLAALLLGLYFIADAKYAVGLKAPILVLGGSLVPFLALNKPKAKVFMGDVGSLPIGAVLGVFVSVLALPRFQASLYLGLSQKEVLNRFHPVTWLALFVVSGMMIVELVPVPLQILSVKVRKKKLFSFTPIHHAFEKKGWPETKVVAVFFIAQLLFSLIAIAIAFGARAGGSIEFSRFVGDFL